MMFVRPTTFFARDIRPVFYHSLRKKSTNHSLSRLIDSVVDGDDTFRSVVAGTKRRPCDSDIRPDQRNGTEKKRVICHENRSMLQISSNDEIVQVMLDLPGVKKDDVNVAVEDGLLRIHAERDKTSKEGKVCKKYIKIIPVDEAIIDIDEAHASLNDGVLTIKLPKMLAEAKPTTIDVAVEATTLSPGENSMTYSFDIPGVSIEDIKVRLEDGDVLLVQGERKRNISGGGSHRTYTISRRVVVDQRSIDTSSIRASLVDGVLTVTAMKRQHPTSAKTIPVSSKPHRVLQGTEENEKEKEKKNEKRDEIKNESENRKRNNSKSRATEEAIVVETVSDKEEEESGKALDLTQNKDKPVKNITEEADKERAKSEASTRETSC